MAAAQPALEARNGTQRSQRHQFPMENKDVTMTVCCFLFAMLVKRRVNQRRVASDVRDWSSCRILSPEYSDDLRIPRVQIRYSTKFVELSRPPSQNSSGILELLHVPYFYVDS